MGNAPVIVGPRSSGVRNQKLLMASFLVASSAGKRASGATTPISNPKPKGLRVFIGVPLLLEFRMLTARIENSVRHKI